ncbi:MAG: hypothetical protein QY306_09535 [Anaerolineales bacterium]|nr:MAG: hypothetical protein QY306_09535 [Anaerolineales bacterium]
MSRYEISLDLSEYGHLDEFALLACQDYNFGNESKWFNAFRGGLYGFRARVNGFLSHYQIVHAWIPTPRQPNETEHHLASIFFCMDSSIECFAYALNALGFAARPDLFRDVKIDRSLRQISPKDILGEDPTKLSKVPVLGYKTVFPTLQMYWQSNSDVIGIIIEQHDVSKHRETIFEGGKSRSDPPSGFYESIGIQENDEIKWMYEPMAEIILRNNPKSAHVAKKSQEVKDFITLESLADKFVNFIQESGKLAFQDAKENIELKHTNFSSRDE